MEEIIKKLQELEELMVQDLENNHRSEGDWAVVEDAFRYGKVELALSLVKSMKETLL